MEDKTIDLDNIDLDNIDLDNIDLKDFGITEEELEDIELNLDEELEDETEAQLQSELESVGTDDSSLGAYSDNSISSDDNSSIEDYTLDKDEMVQGVIEEEESHVIEKEDFVSDTGEIVVMSEDTGDSFKLEYIDIRKIAVVSRIRKSQNVEDLVKSIKSTGLLEPITVAPTATEDVYVLLSGYRRLLACAKSGKKNIPCVVNNKVSTSEIPILEALYNHNRTYTIKEKVDYIEYLEKEKGIWNATMIEYLLQLNNGDYTKLKDILADNDEDIVSKLFAGTYNIETAFKKLEQRRKKETQEQKELQKAEKVYGEDGSGVDVIEGSGETLSEEPELSEEEIETLAVNATDLDDEVEGDSLEEMIEEGKDIKGYEDHKQDPNNREKLDPLQRKAILARDNNTCQICKEISGPEYTEVLDVHHIIEVYLGGKDNDENLLTACTVCHKLVHLYARGDLHMRKLEDMGEEEREKFKRIVKLGNIIRKGMEAKGMKVAELKKVDNADTIGRRLKGSSDQIAT